MAETRRFEVFGEPFEREVLVGIDPAAGQDAQVERYTVPVTWEGDQYVIDDAVLEALEADAEELRVVAPRCGETTTFVDVWRRRR